MTFLKKITPFVLLLILLISCKKKDEYKLHGTIKGLNNQELILQFVTFSSATDIDTCTTDENGTYKFVGKVSEPGIYRIMAGDKYWLLRLENEEVVLNANALDPDLRDVEILKSKKAMAFQEAIDLFINQQDKVNALRDQYKTRQLANASPQELKDIENEYLELEKTFTQEIEQRIEESDDPIRSIYLMNALKRPEDIPFIKKKLSVYAQTYPNSTYIIEMREQIAKSEKQLAQQQEQAQQTSTVKVGDIAPNIVQKNPQGVDLDLESLRGKVVLVDFWASWCKPCRIENPSLVNLYNTYKDKGFTVFSVSLDKDRNAWLAAIEQDKLTWKNHVSDLQFWNNAAAQLYGVSSIPATFLLDKEGKVIESNLRGEALEKEVAKLLDS